MGEDVRVFGYCEECGSAITDNDKAYIDSEGRYIPNENIDAVLKAAREKYPNLYCDVVEHPHWGCMLEIHENKDSKRFKHRFRVEGK